MAFTTDMMAGIPAPGDFFSTVPSAKRRAFLDSEPNGNSSTFQALTTPLYAITTDKFAGCVTTVCLAFSH
jgi:hypothetical protein